MIDTQTKGATNMINHEYYKIYEPLGGPMPINCDGHAVHYLVDHPDLFTLEDLIRELNYAYDKGFSNGFDLGLVSAD